MSSEFDVSEDAKELVSEIISKNNWEPVSEVKYYPGTELGDGYASKHAGVEIITKKETIRLFVKYAHKFPNSMDMSIEKFYTTETHFYDTVYPAYKKFLEEKCVENGFHNAPKCYGTSAKNVIALENLKDRGFTLYDRKQTMDDKHISLVLKTFAKFHAVSFAFKDQNRERYDQLVANTNLDFMGCQSAGKDSPPVKMVRDLIITALNKLDPVADKRMLEKCNAEELFNTIMDVHLSLNEYSIITQGDCWCNNIMFLYEIIKLDERRKLLAYTDLKNSFRFRLGVSTKLGILRHNIANKATTEENKGNPVDITLVDWQVLRPASPVYDISYFFYTTANEEALSKLKSYLREYYTELSLQIKKLGSDPDQLYPFSVFEKEWKLYCKFGFAMAFLLLKLMLVEKDEIPRFEDVDPEEIKKMDMIDFFPKFNGESEYMRRLRVLGEFMISNNYI